MPPRGVDAAAPDLMRSLLFVPGDSERKLARAVTAGADALILDLEDAVVPDRKQQARDIVVNALQKRPKKGPTYFVRINALSSDLVLHDLAIVMQGAPDGIVLPKCGGLDQIQVLDQYLAALEARERIPVGRTEIIGIVTETAASVLKLANYVEGHARLVGLMWGGEDLAADLGATSNRRPDGPYDDPFRLARTGCLLAAAACSAVAIDAVYTKFSDSVGLTVEAEEARRMGFTAKAAIHPDQIEHINRVFSPSKEERRWAERVISAFSHNSAAGAVRLGGEMLDRPHLRRAQRILAALRKPSDVS